MSLATTSPSSWAVADLERTVTTTGIAPIRGAFSAEWVGRLREDFDVLFAEARSRTGGTAARGPERHYFAVPPERLRGFLDLATHPAVTELSRQLLGPAWAIAEVGFDVPLPGARDQPWHRDFVMPPETRDGGVLSSLAFNVTTVTVTPDMGPLEVAPGTQWEPGDDFEYGMFPPPERAAHYGALAERRMPVVGDASVRTGLMMHRGTANRSATARPVLVLGAVAAGVDTSAAHDLMLTRAYAAGLPAEVREHLRCTLLVEELVPMTQRHDIEGLKMGG